METNREEPEFSGIDFCVNGKDKTVATVFDKECKLLDSFEINKESNERYLFMIQELNNFCPAPTQKDINHFILRKIAELQTHLKQHTIKLLQLK